MGCVIGKRSTVDNNVDAVNGLRLPAPLIRGRPVKQISHSLTVVEVSATENGDDDAHPTHSTLELEKRQHGGESYSHSYSVGFPSINIRRRRSKLDPYAITTQKKGWPTWLSAVAGEAINNFTPRSANTFEKIDKIGQGTYSNVYRARDLITGKVVALKKVRFDNLEPESVKFMAREILILHRLRGHPNVINLEGLVTSRLSTSLYLMFEYMDHDLSGLLATSSSNESTKFPESQVKCYMKQLLSGLEHCHKNGVLHRDIKGSNLLINENGILKLADFGLATFYNPDSKKQPLLTSRVVTLWYRPPELLLGATSYGVGVDLWSAGCILAELLAGKPILPGRTEVEQLHRIFKLCGSPSEEYWKNHHHRFPNTTQFKLHQPYKRRVSQVFKDFPLSSVSLLESLLSIDPGGRGTATAALNSEFFLSEPYASEPSSLPKYPPSKEMDLKLKNEAAAKKRTGQTSKSNPTGGVTRVRDRGSSRATNAEIHINPDRLRVDGNNRKSKSEKFPPPHQDGAVGIQLPVDTSSSSTSKPSNDDDRFDKSCSDSKLWNWKSTRGGGLQNHHSSSGIISREEKAHHTMNMAAPSRRLVNLFRPLSLRAAQREDENTGVVVTSR